MKSPLSIVASALLTGFLAATARSQVVLSEIEFTTNWIEIANLGQKSADLSTWSIYQATKTANRPGNYWFGFPPETTLDGGKLLRVHWLADNPTKTVLVAGVTKGKPTVIGLVAAHGKPANTTFKVTVSGITGGSRSLNGEHTASYVSPTSFSIPIDTTLATGTYKGGSVLLNSDSSIEIFTGKSIFHFLFGLHAEPLDGNQGALALMSTQSNSQVNAKEVIQDWVSWGTGGFKREDLAVAANRWVKGSIAAAATGSPTPSLAYAYSNVSSAHSNLDWFLDFSPTPGVENLGGAKAELFGAPCSKLLAPARMVSNGVPAQGNRFFFIGVDRRIAANELPFVMFSPTLDRQGLIKVLGCPLYIGLNGLAGVAFPANSQGLARLPLNPENFKSIAGVPVGIQWLVLDLNSAQTAFTGGMQLQIGK
ncbi:MAG: hypothetical protein ACE5F1_18995 [Planctomycetota bacterium]